MSPKLKFYVPQGLENVKALLGIEVEIVVNIDKNIEANPVTFYPQTKAKNKITIKEFLEGLLKEKLSAYMKKLRSFINSQKFN